MVLVRTNGMRTCLIGLVTEDLLEIPALILRNWLSLDDADLVAYRGVAIFIVSIEFLRTLNDFLKAWVRHTVSILNYDGLIHRCRDNDADASLADAGCLCFRFAHDKVILIVVMSLALEAALRKDGLHACCFLANKCAT